MATTNSSTRGPRPVEPLEVDDVVQLLADLHAALSPRPVLHVVQDGAA